MAKGAYVGVGGVARKVKNVYVGVGGIARKVKKVYVGVGNVARLAFGGIDPGGDWNKLTPSGVSGNMRQIIYGDGYWFLRTSSGIYYSASLTGTWTYISSADNDIIIAYENGYWMKAYRGSCYTTDLTVSYSSWPYKQWNLNAQPRAIKYANGSYLVTQDDGYYAYATSLNGTWSNRQHGTRAYYDIAYGNGYWVIQNTYGDTFYCTVLGTWSSANSSGANGGALIFDGTQFVMAINTGGSNREILYAADPSGTWLSTASSLPSDPRHGAMAFVGGNYIVGGESGTIVYGTSVPGMFSSKVLDTTSRLDGVAYGENKLVVVVADSSALWYIE